MTYALVARCPRTGAFGTVVTSSSIAVAARCAWVSAQGAIGCQNVTDPQLAVLGLRLLAQGYGAHGVLAQMVASTPYAEWRQLGVIDGNGATALHSGQHSLDRHAEADGDGCFALGNLLADKAVPSAMVAAFMAAPDEDLPERLVQALEAGKGAGGEISLEMAAGLKVHRGKDWPQVDLRVDWSPTAISDLRALWGLYRTQEADFLARAINPENAPGFH